MANHSIRQNTQAQSISYYLERAAHIFQDAAQAPSHAITKRFFGICDQTVMLQFTEPTSADILTPALAHLAIPQTAIPDLVITVTDRVAAGREMLPPELLSSTSAEKDGQTNPVLFLQDANSYLSIEPMAGRLNLLDVGQRRGLFWLPSPSHLTLRDRSQPFRAVLYWWLRQRGCHLVHAAAVGSHKGGVLIAGKAGAGKSTAALACLGSQLLYAGDDHVIVGMHPQPLVYCLYNSATLDRSNLARNLPHLTSAVGQPVDPDDDKDLLFIHHAHPHQVISRFPLRAVVIPGVTGLPKTTLEEASPAEALASLAPSTILQLPGAGQAEFRWIAQLVQQIPAYRLHVGTDLSDVPSCIMALLEDLEDEV